MWDASSLSGISKHVSCSCVCSVWFSFWITWPERGADPMPRPTSRWVRQAGPAATSLAGRKLHFHPRAWRQALVPPCSPSATARTWAHTALKQNIKNGKKIAVITVLLKATVAIFFHCFRGKSDEGGDHCIAIDYCYSTTHAGGVWALCCTSAGRFGVLDTEKRCV